MRILLYPGEVGALENVNDVLRARREEKCAARLREIEKRTATGAPLDDGDGHIAPLPAYEPDPRLDGVRVRCRVLSAKALRALHTAEAIAWGVVRKGLAAGDDAGVAAGTEELFEARRAMVAAAVVEIDIDGETMPPASAETLDVLERNGLLTPVAEAAAAAQDLPLGKHSRSGSPLRSTSGASTAPSARSIDEALADAMAEHSKTASQPSSLGPDTRPTPAPGGT